MKMTIAACILVALVVGQSAFYDVWATLGFGGIATEPDDNG